MVITMPHDGIKDENKTGGWCGEREKVYTTLCPSRTYNSSEKGRRFTADTHASMVRRHTHSHNCQLTLAVKCPA